LTIIGCGLATFGAVPAAFGNPVYFIEKQSVESTGAAGAFGPDRSGARLTSAPGLAEVFRSRSRVSTLDLGGAGGGQSRAGRPAAVSIRRKTGETREGETKSTVYSDEKK